MATNQISRRDFLKGTAAAAAGAAFWGLSGAPVLAEGEAIYAPGTYTASAPGYSSIVKVTLTFSETEITDCVINASGETLEITLHN